MPQEKLPERWEKYDPLGNVIEGTRIVAFKVPLKMELCRRYSEDLYFTPDSLISMCKEKDLDLGLIVDLTFTSRYYDCEVVKTQGIQYEKVKIPGQKIPSKALIRSFYGILDRFLEENSGNRNIIGIHCTHGVNRTGYLICRYMIEKMGISPETAIRAFGVARGYPIERENYLEDLRKRSTDTFLGSSEDEEEEKELNDYQDHRHQPPNRHGNLKNGLDSRCDKRRHSEQRFSSYHSGRGGSYRNNRNGPESDYKFCRYDDRSGSHSYNTEGANGYGSYSHGNSNYDNPYNNRRNSYNNRGNSYSGYGSNSGCGSDYGQFGRRYDNTDDTSSGKHGNRYQSQTKYNNRFKPYSYNKHEAR